MQRYDLIAFAILMATVLLNEPVFAKSRCRQSFETNIKGIMHLANNLSPACYRETDKGGDNLSRIRAACSEKEYQTVMQIAQGGNQLAILCDDQQCKPELTQLQVCGERKPLQYYIDKLGIR